MLWAKCSGRLGRHFGDPPSGACVIRDFILYFYFTSLSHIVVLEALPAHPVLPSVPGRPPAGLPHVHVMESMVQPSRRPRSERSTISTTSRPRVLSEWKPVFAEELARLPAALPQRLLSACVLGDHDGVWSRQCPAVLQILGLVAAHE
jgi:hypothetical protein